MEYSDFDDQNDNTDEVEPITAYLSGLFEILGSENGINIIIHAIDKREIELYAIDAIERYLGILEFSDHTQKIRLLEAIRLARIYFKEHKFKQEAVSGKYN